MTEAEIQRPQKTGKMKKQKKGKRIFNSDEKETLESMCFERPSLDEANQYFSQTSRKSVYSPLNEKDTKKVSEDERHFP